MAGTEEQQPIDTSMMWRVGQSRAGELKKILERNRHNSHYKQLLTERQQLPVFRHRSQLLNVFRNNRAFVVAGETGSGKSTQIPQFILEVIFCVAFYYSVY